MAHIKLCVTYDTHVEIQEILSLSQKYANMDEEKEKVESFIKMKLQQSFDAGRKFQQQNVDMDI